MGDIESIIIHHLSDIHFGSFEQLPINPSSGYEEIVKKASTPFSVQYLRFLEHLKKEERPHFVIISGDIASTGDMGSLERGVKFCNHVIKYMGKLNKLKRIGNAKQRLLVVPGNHDVDWEEKNESQKARLSKFITAFSEFRTPHRPGNKCPVFYYPDVNLLFWCIDSCILSGWTNKELQAIQKEFKDALKNALNNNESMEKISQIIIDLSRIDPGFIDIKSVESFKDEYKRLVDKYTEEKMSSAIKCAVLHHPVSAFPIPTINPFSHTINSGLLKKTLQDYGFDIIFHGHYHEARMFYEDMDITTKQQGIHIISGGTLSGATRGGQTFNKIVIRKCLTDGQFSCYVTEIKSKDMKFDDYSKPNLGKFLRKNENIEWLYDKFIDALDQRHEVGILYRLNRELLYLLKKDFTRENAGYVPTWMEENYKKYLSEANRIYAIDIQGMGVWSQPIVYYYLSLQLHYYVMKNCIQSKWDLIMTKDVMKALNRAINNAESKSREGEELWKNSESVSITPEITPRMEIVRILLWTPEQLRDKRSELLIKIHDHFHIPLFYLDINKLKDRDPKWNKLEYIIFLREQHNSLPVEGLWIKPLDYSMKYDDILTGKGEIRRVGKPLSDFNELINHPDILLAVDAYNYESKGCNKA